MYDSDMNALLSTRSVDESIEISSRIPDGALVTNAKHLGPHSMTVLVALAIGNRWKPFAELAPLRRLDLVSAVNDGELSLLHYLAQKVRWREVAQLVRLGVSVDLLDSRGFTALELACVNVRNHPVEFQKTAEALCANGGQRGAWASALLGLDPEVDFPERVPRGIGDRLVAEDGRSAAQLPHDPPESAARDIRA